MKIRLTERFKKAYKKLQPEIQKKVDKAITLLLTNHKHPSIQVRKLESKPDKWYLRVGINYRLRITTLIRLKSTDWLALNIISG